MPQYHRKHTVHAIQIPEAITILTGESTWRGQQKRIVVAAGSYLIVENGKVSAMAKDDFERQYDPHDVQDDDTTTYIGSAPKQQQYYDETVRGTLIPTIRDI